MAWAVVDRDGCMWKAREVKASMEHERDALNAYAETGHYKACGPYTVIPLYAHPAATAREEAWKALLAYAECEQSFESPTTEAMYATLARHGWVEGTPPIRFVMDLRAKALALARSTGGA